MTWCPDGRIKGVRQAGRFSENCASASACARDFARMDMRQNRDAAVTPVKNLFSVDETGKLNGDMVRYERKIPEQMQRTVAQWSH